MDQSIQVSKSICYHDERQPKLTLGKVLFNNINGIKFVRDRNMFRVLNPFYLTIGYILSILNISDFLEWTIATSGINYRCICVQSE